MRDKTQLNDLSRTYLKYVEDIDAGFEALKTDVREILYATAERLRDAGDSAVDCNGYRLKKVFAGTEPPLQVRVAMRLRWEPAKKTWPTIEFDLDKDESSQEDSFRKLVAYRLFQALAVPEIDQEGLLTDTVGELCRYWTVHGCQAVESFLAKSEIETARQGWSVIQAVSASFVKKMGSDRMKAIEWETRSGAVDYQNKTWPCYFEWYQPIPKTRKRISWWIGFDPAWKGTEKPALGLWVYSIKDHRTQFVEALGALPDGGEVRLCDWDTKLQPYLDGEVSADTVADELLGEAIQLYSQVVAEFPHSG